MVDLLIPVLALATGGVGYLLGRMHGEERSA